MDKTKSDDTYIMHCMYSWEKLRILYNIIMLAVGIPVAILIYKTIQGLSPTFHGNMKTIFDAGGIIKGAVVFGLFANLFYCLGPLVDIYYWVFIKKQMSKLFRYGLFIAGLLFSLIVQLSIWISFSTLKGCP